MSLQHPEIQDTIEQTTESHAPEICSSIEIDNILKNSNKSYFSNKVLQSESKFCQRVVQYQAPNVMKSNLFNGETFLTFLATNATSLGNKLNELKASILIGKPPI